MPISSYTIYPEWGGWSGTLEDEALRRTRELAAHTAERRGWIVAGCTVTYEGFEAGRGERYCGVVDFRQGAAL